MSLPVQSQYTLATGDGTPQQTFPFYFRCLQETDLHVEFRSAAGVENVLTPNVDYTVTLNADQVANPGGFINLTDANLPPPGNTITVFIGNGKGFTQPIALPVAGPFSAPVIESQLDNTVQYTQVLRDQMAAAVRAEMGEVLFPLPGPAARANNVLAFDIFGQPEMRQLMEGSSLLPPTLYAGPGSVTLPSYSFVGRVDDGMWSPAAGVLAWSLGGAEALRLEQDRLTQSGDTPVYRFAPGVLNSFSGFEWVASSTVAGSSKLNVVTGEWRHSAGSHTFLTNGQERLRIDSGGRLSGTALHNNPTLPTGTANQYIASGTYTPALTNVSNITSSTAFQSQWLRVGNVVTVSGLLQINTTAANTPTVLGVSLPIPSAFDVGSDLSGHITRSDEFAPSLAGSALANAANDRANLAWRSDAITGSQFWNFSFTYLIK